MQTRKLFFLYQVPIFYPAEDKTDAGHIGRQHLGKTEGIPFIYVIIHSYIIYKVMFMSECTGNMMGQAKNER